MDIGFIIGLAVEGGLFLLLMIITIVVALKKGDKQEPQQIVIMAPPQKTVAETKTAAVTETEEPVSQDYAKPVEGPVFEAHNRTFEEAYVELTEEQKRYAAQVEAHAMGKPFAKRSITKNSLNVRSGGHLILKMRISRGQVVASYKLESGLLKDYRRETNDPARIRLKETELRVDDEASASMACHLVDLMMEQIEQDRELAKARRREARRAKRAQNAEKSDEVAAETEVAAAAGTADGAEQAEAEVFSKENETAGEEYFG